jgi:hypothetical protein
MQCVPPLACEPGFSRCGRDCVDLGHNETRCGSCDVSCQPDELCLSVCVTPASTPALCSNDASVRCEDDLFCNGTAACNPASNQALASGCVLAVAPCAAGLCDEAQNQCSSVPATGTSDAGVSCTALESPVALQNAPVDVVIAVDTSGSMAPYFCAVAASLSAFMDGLGPEMRAVTLYDMGALAGTSTTLCGAADPVANTAIAQDPTRYRHLMVTVDSFNGFSQLLTEHQNYGSFLRPNAATHFVMVTDDDNSTPAADFKTQMEALLGHAFVFHALVADGQNGCLGAQVGTQYLTLADLTGGKKLPICSAMPSTTGTELTASVRASSATSCRVTDVSASPELVQLLFKPGSGAQTQLPRATDAQGCATNLAWSYAGSTVTLCPAACPLARQGGQLVLGTGCAPLTL